MRKKDTQKFFSRKLCFILLYNIIFTTSLFSQIINDIQVIHQNHWIYDALETLEVSTGVAIHSEVRPMTVGQLKFNLERIPYETLSTTGQKLYDKAHNFLYTNGSLLKNDALKLSSNLKTTPEGYYKSNPEISWTHNYYFEDNFITVPLDIGISNYVSLGTELFLGKTFSSMQDPHNYTNLPISNSLNTMTHNVQFIFPRFSYSSVGATFRDWGINFIVGKEGQSIGRTELGSIIYNDTFETDTFFQLNLFTKQFKYTLHTIQIETYRYLYLHQIDFSLFNKLKIGIIEGSLIRDNFELRYLNPLMIMHSFIGWKQYSTPKETEFYRESRFCAYLAFMFDYMPIKNLRIYGLYAQNEMQTASEKQSDYGKVIPDSLGGQLGIEYLLPDSHDGYWKFNAEGIYTSPFLYLKHTPESSLVRKTYDLTSTYYSWIGTPYGPDTIAAQVGFSYTHLSGWDVGIDYIFAADGSTDFSIFEDKNKDGYYTYYPETQYRNHCTTLEEAIAQARYMGLTGIPEYRNDIVIKGSYAFLDNLSLKGQMIYTFIFNNKHTNGNFQQGIELSLALKYQIQP